jgi:leukemia factor-related protein
VYVADSEKNEEYWAKRVKNNVAARRSREARRLKENQVNTYSRDAIIQGALW